MNTGIEPRKCLHHFASKWQTYSEFSANFGGKSIQLFCTVIPRPLQSSHLVTLQGGKAYDSAPGKALADVLFTPCKRSLKENIDHFSNYRIVPPRLCLLMFVGL